MSTKAKIYLGQPGAAPFPCDLPVGEYTVGRSEKSRIRLRHPEVSETHAIIKITPDGGTIEDCNSSNGTWIFGGKISTPVKLTPKMEIAIGPYKLTIASLPLPEPETPSRVQTPVNTPAAPAPRETVRDEVTTPAPEPEPERPASPVDPAVAARREIKNQIHRELVQRLDLKRLSAARASGEELNKRAKETLNAIVSEVRSKLPPGIDPKVLAREIYNEAMRLGPLEGFWRTIPSPKSW